MKFLVVFFASAALCAVSATPLVPRDNSHYVEGVSRYIWMPDGEGNPHLVDLHAPVEEEVLKTRNGSNNAYWLFTRQNPTNSQILVNGNVDSIRNSNYNGNRPTKVITHGWVSDGTSSWIPQLTEAFLAVSDVNVIVLDWNSASTAVYTTAVQAVPDVGVQCANFLTFLFNNAGGNWNNVHMIGLSLGAHVVGNAGRVGFPARVTGLDPAGPQWEGNPNALNRNSAIYVESIHTNAGFLGIMEPISHGNFYPNGGQDQPGCGIDVVCSHGRPADLFISSVWTDHLVGRLCNNLNDALNQQCWGTILPLGNANLAKRGLGIYGLSTGSSWPY